MDKSIKVDFRPIEPPKLVQEFKPELSASLEKTTIIARSIDDQEALSKLDRWLWNNRVRRSYCKRLQISDRKYWLVPCLQCQAEVDVKYHALFYKTVNIGPRFSVPHTNPFAPGRVDYRSEVADKYVTSIEHRYPKVRTTFKFCVPIYQGQDFGEMLKLLAGTQSTQLAKIAVVFPTYPGTYDSPGPTSYFEKLISFAMPKAASILNPARERISWGQSSCLTDDDFKMYECKMGVCRYQLIHVPIMEVFGFDPRDGWELHWLVNLSNGSVVGDIAYSNFTKIMLFLERNKIL